MFIWRALRTTAIADAMAAVKPRPPQRQKKPQKAPAAGRKAAAPQK